MEWRQIDSIEPVSLPRYRSEEDATMEVHPSSGDWLVSSFRGTRTQDKPLNSQVADVYDTWPPQMRRLEVGQQ